MGIIGAGPRRLLGIPTLNWYREGSPNGIHRIAYAKKDAVTGLLLLCPVCPSGRDIQGTGGRLVRHSFSDGGRLLCAEPRFFLACFNLRSGQG
jgi:hypothetical protein